MNQKRKEEHIRNIAFCIANGACGYVTDSFRIDDLPAPQTAGTFTQQAAYDRGKARIILPPFLDSKPNTTTKMQYNVHQKN